MVLARYATANKRIKWLSEMRSFDMEDTAKTLFMSHSDIPKMIEVLQAETKRADKFAELSRMYLEGEAEADEARDEARKKEGVALKSLGWMTIDRDHYKARYRALEKAIKSHSIYDICEICGHGNDENYSALCGYQCGDNHHNFEFDEQRFLDESEND